MKKMFSTTVSVLFLGAAAVLLSQFSPRVDAGLTPIPPILIDACIDGCWDDYHDAMDDAEDDRDEAYDDADDQYDDDTRGVQDAANAICAIHGQSSRECAMAQTDARATIASATWARNQAKQAADAAYAAAVAAAQNAVNACIENCENTGNPV